MSHGAHVALVVGLEYQLVAFAGIAAKHLPGRGKEYPFGKGNDAFDRDPGIVDAVFSAHQILRDQRPIDKWQHVIVHAIDLAKSGSHFAHARHKTARQRRKRDEAFFQVDALLAKSQEEIALARKDR